MSCRVLLRVQETRVSLIDHFQLILNGLDILILFLGFTAEILCIEMMTLDIEIGYCLRIVSPRFGMNLKI